MKKFIIATFIALTSSLAIANTVKYVAIPNLEVRAYSNNAYEVIDHLKQYQAVTVFEDIGDWSRLTDVTAMNQRWVHSNKLCDTPKCGAKQSSSQSALPVIVKKQSKTALKTVNVTRVKSEPKPKIIRSSGGCACGEGYCYGPRGGRYCITSGGNKRYL